MATYIPAIRAHMGDVDYFVSVVTFGEVARMVDYIEDVDGWTAETPPELKLQRKLNIQRVEREMVPYLTTNEDHFYSALTVEIRPAPGPDGPAPIDFQSRERFPGGVEFGVLTLDGTEVLYALDGQHRLKSIELAIRSRPDLARQHLTLILVPFRSVERSQTLFSDLNRYAKGPSKSISILFTHREAIARLAKLTAGAVPLLRDRVNMESTSLSSNSRYFITLSTLYEVTKTLAGERADAARADEQDILRDLIGVWEFLTETLSEWQHVARGEEHPAYLRQRYLNMHGVAQQAIAIVVGEAQRNDPLQWHDAIGRLRHVDWRLANPAWQGVSVHGGRVNNTTTSIHLLAETLGRHIGLATEGVAG